MLFIIGMISLSSTNTFDENPQSCTIVTVSIGDSVLFGNNEDFSMKGTGYWFVPSETGYGSIIFGYLGNWHPADRFAQGGMNEVGLCCDANALPASNFNRDSSLERAPMDFFPPILEECATVEETIQWFQTHNFGSRVDGQFHFADALGDAVVISAGINGEWQFTRKNTSNYLLSTNFNVANTNNGLYPCWRYEAADDLLPDFTVEENVTVSNLVTIMNATIQKGAYPTQYTNIFNPQTLDVYIWHNGDFSKNITLNLGEELENLTRPVYYKIPVMLGQPDWFFPLQFPTLAVVGVGLLGVMTYTIVLIAKRIKNRKKKQDFSIDQN